MVINHLNPLIKYELKCIVTNTTLKQVNKIIQSVQCNKKKVYRQSPIVRYLKQHQELPSQTGNRIASTSHNSFAYLFAMVSNHWLNSLLIISTHHWQLTVSHGFCPQLVDRRNQCDITVIALAVDTGTGYADSVSSTSRRPSNFEAT